MLAEHDARATFFVCGLNVARQAHAARRALSLGHEIGNHTHTHPLLLRCGPERVRWEVSRAQREIEDRLGVGPHMFRPPYGVRSPWLPRALEAEGLLCAHWSVIGNDWKLPAERIAGRVLQLGSEPGAIVCLHDGDGTREHVDRRATTDALRTILPALKGQGFELTTVSDAATAAEVYNSASAGAFNSPTDSI